MSRTSTIKDKTEYQLRREELGWSREEASEHLETISPERLERIESKKYMTRPDEAMLMSKVYKAPSLRNYFCTHECEIGMKDVPEVKVKHLTEIVVEMLASLGSVKECKEKLIDITSDGIIEEDEVPDFIFIQDELERISKTVEALQLWAENKLALGEIDMEAYTAARSEE